MLLQGLNVVFSTLSTSAAGQADGRRCHKSTGNGWRAVLFIVSTPSVSGSLSVSGSISAESLAKCATVHGFRGSGFRGSGFFKLYSSFVVSVYGQAHSNLVASIQGGGSILLPDEGAGSYPHISVSLQCGVRRLQATQECDKSKTSMTVSSLTFLVGQQVLDETSNCRVH